MRGTQPDGGTDEEEMRMEMHEKEKGSKESVRMKMSKQLKMIWSQSCTEWARVSCWDHFFENKYINKY